MTESPGTTGRDEGVHVLALNKRSWHHSRAGGSERNLEVTLKGLAARGHTVDLLVGPDEGRDGQVDEEGVRIHRVGVGSRLPAPWDVVAAYVAVSLAVYLYAYRLRPDVLYAVNVPLPWIVVSRLPRVSIFHHVAIDTFFDTHPFPQNLLGYVSQVVGVRLERSNPSVAVSPSTRRALVDRGHDPDSVYEIRNGLDLDRYRPGEPSLEPRIVYVGGLERYKGVDRLPAIHRALLEASDTPVHLDVAGRDGPVGDRIAAYCRETDTATFHGYVSEETKVDLLQRAWVFVAPSRVEGWGIAVLEANACATPAVGSDVDGLRDSIRNGETGRLVDGTDPRAFADAVRDLVEDDETRAALSTAARGWAERHSWDRSIDQLEELLVAVAAGERPPSSTARR